MNALPITIAAWAALLLAVFINMHCVIIRVQKFFSRLLYRMINSEAELAGSTSSHAPKIAS
jgi:hypothetical protein